MSDPFWLGIPRFTEPALCAETDPELFFPEKGGPVTEVIRTCRACLAKLECLTWAMDNDEPHGYWGGLSESQRRRLRRKRDAA